MNTVEAVIDSLITDGYFRTTKEAFHAFVSFLEPRNGMVDGQKLVRLFVLSAEGQLPFEETEGFNRLNTTLTDYALSFRSHKRD